MDRRAVGPLLTSLLRSAPLASLAAVVLAIGCSRTPPEPTPVASVSPEPSPRSEVRAAIPSASGPAAPARCLRPVASVAPPIAPPAGAACPPDPHPETKMPLADVSFPEARSEGGPLRIEVELAMKPNDIERGLMYRRAMGDDHGMLFKLDGRRDHTFWMHNTCIALDMLFIDDDGTIVGIVEGAAPLTDTTRSVGCPSSYVLEVNGGWTRKRGVAPGQKVALPQTVR